MSWEDEDRGYGAAALSAFLKNAIATGEVPGVVVAVVGKDGCRWMTTWRSTCQHARSR
jgi:hypothetical protein